MSQELLPAGYQTTNLNKVMERFRYFIKNAKLDLKTYQEDGVKWCIYKELVDRCDETAEKRGGFLSDEMGLGKTITMLGTIYTNFAKGRTTLIVVPSILLKQWYLEIVRLTGNQSVIYKRKMKKEVMEKAPIVLTTYGMLAKDSALFEINWFRVIFDEAHHLRNKNTIIHQRSLVIKTKIFWFVSGTPIQNKIVDFRNLCSILGIPSTVDLSEIIQTSVLKRTKKTASIVIPEVVCENVVVKWENPTEKMISDGFHEILSFRHSASSTPETIEDALNEYNIQSVSSFYPSFLYALNSLYPEKLLNTIKSRQMCVLPSLVMSVMTKLTQLVPQNEEWAQIIQSLPLYHSKLNSVVEKLIETSIGKLVFCHFREEMTKLKKMLINKGVPESEIFIIDGRVSPRKRNDCILRHPKYLLLQIQTGCEGLNLQEHYSEIYFVSPNWNPAIEQQAIARCHRIGQTNTVRVFRFYMTEQTSDITIEEWIYVKQKKKLKLYL